MRRSSRAAVLSISKGPQSHLRFCWWYRSSHGTDFDVSERAGPVLPVIGPASADICQAMGP